MKSIELTMYRLFMQDPIWYRCQDVVYTLGTLAYVELGYMDSDLMTPLKDCIMEQLYEELYKR